MYVPEDSRYQGGSLAGAPEANTTTEYFPVLALAEEGENRFGVTYDWKVYRWHYASSVIAPGARTEVPYASLSAAVREQLLGDEKSFLRKNEFKLPGG